MCGASILVCDSSNFGWELRKKKRKEGQRGKNWCGNWQIHLGTVRVSGTMSATLVDTMYNTEQVVIWSTILLRVFIIILTILTLKL